MQSRRWAALCPPAPDATPAHRFAVNPAADGEPNSQPPEAAATAELPSVPYWKLYSTADRLDTILMAIAAVGSIANGGTWPTFSILFAGEWRRLLVGESRRQAVD